MRVEFIASFEAGGYPAPTYKGEKRFAMNLADDLSAADALDAAADRARQIVSSDMLFDRSMVTITNVQLAQLHLR